MHKSARPDPTVCRCGALSSRCGLACRATAAAAAGRAGAGRGGRSGPLGGGGGAGGAGDRAAAAAPAGPRAARGAPTHAARTHARAQRTHMYARTHPRAHTQIHTQARTRTHAQTHARAHTQTHAHAHRWRTWRPSSSTPASSTCLPRSPSARRPSSDTWASPPHTRYRVTLAPLPPQARSLRVQDALSIQTLSSKLYTAEVSAAPYDSP